MFTSSCVFTDVYKFIHTYTYTYVYSYIHTYIHTYTGPSNSISPEHESDGMLGRSIGYIYDKVEATR